MQVVVDFCVFICAYVYMLTVSFECVHDCNCCAGQCGEVYAGRMRMAEVCGARARSPEASILGGL